VNNGDLPEKNGGLTVDNCGLLMKNGGLSSLSMKHGGLPMTNLPMKNGIAILISTAVSE
jgi:hypothetical protein